MVVLGFGAHSDIASAGDLLALAEQADRDGLDLVSLSDHPYFGGRLDADAVIGFLLGRTRRIAGLANVTNVPTRPAPMLARTTRSGGASCSAWARADSGTGSPTWASRG